MKRIARILAFSLTAAAMICLVAYQIASSENRLRTGKKIKIAVAAYDPSDPLRGRYLALSPRGFETSDPSSPSDAAHEGGAPVFVFLKEDEKGFSRLERTTDKKPDIHEYLELSYDEKGKIKPPFERFYLNQDEAPEAEKLMRSASSKEAYVIAYLKDGHLTLRELDIGGRVFRAGAE
jgi:hypothetical protein